MQLHSNGKSGYVAELRLGTNFAYEQPISEWQKAAGERARILTLQYVGRTEFDGKRYIFSVVGVANDEQPWSPGYLFLDVQTVQRSLGTALKPIP